MKRTILIILLTALAIAIGIAVMPRPRPRNIPKEIWELPAITVLGLDSISKINIGDAPKNKAVAIFYFDPACEHCQHETEDLIRHPEVLNNTCFYFISLDSMQRLRRFEADYGLRRFKAIRIAKDQELKVLTTLKLKSIPSNILYGRNHKLIQLISGGATASAIDSALREQ